MGVTTLATTGVTVMNVPGTLVGVRDAIAGIVGAPLTSAIVVGVPPPGSCEASNKPASTVATTTMPAAIPLHSCCQSLLADVCMVFDV
jgi:hypothetical protein